jgi:branched-chain amino acid transport system ATP-binding protein
MQESRQKTPEVADADRGPAGGLEVSNLELVYHSVVLVLRGISLSVPAGKVVALLGPNGAGKTSALRAIAGLMDIHNATATKGSITLDGRSILGLPPEKIVRSGVVQVLEGRRIFQDLTVEENLLAGAFVRRDGGRAADMAEFYERFPILGSRKKQIAGYLSGGEQQMLAIARALLARPKLLLLDEPSLGLAPRIVAEIGRLIREVNQRGVGILLVEQNAAVAFDLAEHAYVMENGRIVVEGPTEELREDKDIQEFYLGMGESGRKSYRDVKLYKRRKRWLT